MPVEELVALQRRLNSRIPLLGPWLQGRALRALIRFAEAGSEPAVVELARLAMRHGRPWLAAQAEEALFNLAQRGSAPAREELCRLAIRNEDIPRRRRILAAGYAPQEEAQRALFYFLTDQWQKYETVDFDHRLLRSLYERGGAFLRSRIAAKARQAGRLEWIAVVAPGARGKRLRTMTDAEWQAVVAVLRENSGWDTMWQLTDVAPPRWSALLVRHLAHARWSPPVADRDEFRSLAQLAQCWNGEAASSRLSFRRRAVLEGHTDEVRALAFSPEGAWLASAGGDGAVRLWGLQRDVPTRVLQGHNEPINCLLATPDGTRLISADRSGVTLLWDPLRSEPVAKLVGHSAKILHAAISPEGGFFATADSDGGIQLWDVAGANSLASLAGHDHAVLGMDFTPDGSFLVSIGADCTARVWTVPGGTRHRTLAGHRSDEDTDAVLSMAISASGDRLAIGGTDGDILMWSLPNGHLVARFGGHLRDVTSLVFTLDGSTLISGGGDQTLRFWSMPDGELRASCEAHSAPITRAALSPDGRILATVAGSGLGHDPSVRLWDVAQQRHSQSLYGHSRYISCVAFSGKGDCLATGGGDTTICLWGPELLRLSRLPVSQATLDDLALVQAALHEDDLDSEELPKWQFIEILMRRSRRNDVVLVDKSPRRLTVGEYDIELEG